MQIRNTTPCNQSVHAAKGKGIQVKPVLCVPGDGAIYIDDAEFEKFYASECKAQIDAGILVIGLGQVKSDEDILRREAAELKAAIALVAKYAEKKDKLRAKSDEEKSKKARDEAVEKVAAKKAEEARLDAAGVASNKGEPKA